MKTLMMTVFALFFTSTAHAGYYRYIETCTSLNPSEGHNYKVVIAVHYLSCVDSPVQAETYAYLTEESMSTPADLGDYQVAFLPPPRDIVGTRGTYVGADFALSFPLVPSRDGSSIANLSATKNLFDFQTQTEDQQINDTLLCQGDL